MLIFLSIKKAHSYYKYLNKKNMSEIQNFRRRLNTVSQLEWRKIVLYKHKGMSREALK